MELPMKDKGVFLDALACRNAKQNSKPTSWICV